MDTAKIVTYVFLIIFGIGLFVYMQSYVMALDMSAWAFGGHEIVVSIMPLMPTIFLICMVMIPVYFIAEEAT